MWHRSLLDTIHQAEKRGLCLYGAGFWGETAYKLFTKMGIMPMCFCDDALDKQGKSCQGLPIYSLEEAVRMYPDAVYIPCVEIPNKRVPHNKDVWKRTNWDNMRQKLKHHGVYDSNSELRIVMYLFLLDLDGLDNIRSIWKEDSYGMIEEEFIKVDDIQNLIIFNHMSHSGSIYLEQRMDGHSNILSIPCLNGAIWHVYERRLQYLEGEELLLEMAAQMLGYFHSEYEDLYCVGRSKFYGHYVDQNGEMIKDVYIDPNKFIKYLKLQFEGEVKPKSFGHILKVFYAAYNNCLGKQKRNNTEYWLFFHMHQADFDQSQIYDSFHKNEFKRIENLIIIREPVQHFYSWFLRAVIIGDFSVVLKKDYALWHVLRADMGLTLEKKDGIDNIKVIRFEDLKYRSEATMKSLCRWLNIPYEDILMTTTVNGYQIYFTTYTAEGVKYITGDDTTAVDRKDFSKVLTVWDEARLNMAYAKFKRAYGYENDVPDFTEFDEEELNKIFHKDFKFATIAQKVVDEEGQEEDKYNVNQYVKEKFFEYMRNYREGTEYYDYIRPEDE